MARPKHKKTIRHLQPHSDLGRRGRPGIKGTIDKLNTEVQAWLEMGDVNAAVRLIEFKVREAYKCWDTP